MVHQMKTILLLMSLLDIILYSTPKCLILWVNYHSVSGMTTTSDVRRMIPDRPKHRRTLPKLQILNLLQNQKKTKQKCCLMISYKKVNRIWIAAYSANSTNWFTETMSTTKHTISSTSGPINLIGECC